MEQYVDLHTHTNASDGTGSPSENVRIAKNTGLYAVAITDHDTVAGVKEAMAEGERIGLVVVPGVEISTVDGGQDIHILGYYVDIEDAQFLQRLQQLRDTRDRRNDMIIEKLCGLGLHITMDEVIANVNKRDLKNETIGRPHIADMLVKKGYVATISEAFERYLGKNALAYVNPPRIRPEEAIDWIKEANGTPIIAHPGLYDDDKLVERLLQYGLEGVEAYHSDHTPVQEQKYALLAKQYSVPVTAGSDFHGERHGVVFHAPIGSRKVNADVLQLLQKRKKAH